jgi:hypothetical protein
MKKELYMGYNQYATRIELLLLEPSNVSHNNFPDLFDQLEETMASDL